MKNITADQENNLPVISVKNLSKKYCRDLKHSLWYGVKDTAREFLFRRKANPTLRANEFWVLEDISFDLYPGESLAIIGDNGAGKSTLLKMLYGLIKPDSGEIRIRGKVGALVELGTGFDPVLSGRENISVNALLLGFPGSELKTLIEKVIDFSELEEFIDTPVQYYSSGMVARLAYAIAANLTPTLFLIDEVLAVGDLDFQRKCLNQMLGYLASGGSLILVSHAPYHIQSVCRKGIFLQDGRVEFQGTAIEAMSRYYESRFQHLPDQKSDSQNTILTPERPLAITDVSINAADGGLIHTGTDVKVSIKYRSLKIDAKVGCALMLSTQDDLVCIAGSININPQTLKEGDGEITCVIPKFPLLGGTYLLKIAIFGIENLWSLANVGWGNAPLRFKVEADLDNVFVSGRLVLNQLVELDADWQ